MLEPRDRLLLFEALQPPTGFHFDQGIGTTYTLDLMALLTAPLAFTLYEQQGQEDGRPGVDSLEILESLRRYADQLTIFCHAGRIGLPKVFYPQLAFIENSIVECQVESGGAFHPKVWVLRWTNDAGDVRYRMLCLSRNLTFSRAWDTLLALNGEFSQGRRAKVGRNGGLADFVRALPRLAVRQPIPTLLLQRVEKLASELERTEFELPEGITDLRFWPLGLGGRSRDPLGDAGDRLLVVAPFLTLSRVEELAKGRSNVTIVSTATALGSLARKPRGIGKFYTLRDRAITELDPDHQAKPDSDVEAIEQSDLHAKLYVSESGWDAHLWTGSANAIGAAFEHNVEFVVELIGPRKKFGIDALMTPVKGEVRFINLLQDAADLVAAEPKNAAIEALEDRLERLRESIAAASLEVRVKSTLTATFRLELFCAGTLPVIVDSDLTLRCWPVTVASGNGISLDGLEPGKVGTTFDDVPFSSITSFFAFDIAGRAGGEECKQQFVLNLPLLGAPEGRREQVLRSLLRDRSRMLRFLWLLLADEGLELPDFGSSTTPREQGMTGSSLVPGGLFEMLLRTLDRNPGQLDHLSGLLKLRYGADGEDLLPTGFDSVWDPIWRQRERLRPRAQS